MSTRDLPGHRAGRKTHHAVRSVLIVVLTATGFLAATALPSSATGTQPTRGTAPAGKHVIAAEKADFSTLRGIKRYLRAIDVDPRKVVIQRGPKNYAGPNCPGATWTCTDARSVFQVGTQNTFECSPGVNSNPAGLQQCLIVQGPAAKNVAKCIQKSKNVPFVRQRCSITQTGSTHNEATIVQVADQTSGAPLASLQVVGALQEVGLLQNANASTNRVQIEQEIKQLSETTGTGIVQDQDAYQVVGSPFTATTVPTTGPAMQIAVGDGDNASQIVQKQIQRAKGGATQTQNSGAFGAGAPFEEPADCDDSAVSPEDPNLCVNLDQTAADGTNHQGQLSQSLDQEATTTVVGASQQQGAGVFRGGADGRVHQAITGTSGTSQNQAHQSETLKLFAPSGPAAPTQVQFGGAGCCGFGSQLGGENNQEKISQQKDLDAQGGTEQTATLVGTSSSPDGSCGIDHSAQTNSDQASESASAEPCIALAVVTTCENSVGDGDPVVGECADSSVEACPPGEEPFVSDPDEDGVPNIMCAPEPPVSEIP
jgi:hypothetical protein